MIPAKLTTILKYKLFLSGLSICLVLQLVLTISTVGLNKELKELKSKVLDPIELEKAQLHYAVQLKELDLQIQSLQKQSVPIHSHIELLNYIQALCLTQNVRMISLPEEEKIELESYTISKIHFSLEGDFHSLLKFFYQIEQKDKVVSIEQLSFHRERIKTKHRRKDILLAEVSVNRLINHE